MRRLTTLATAISLSAVLLGATGSAASASTSPDYNTGYTLGHEAYEYGLPLLDMQRVFATETSIKVSDTSGDGPVNQFNSAPHLVIPKASQQTVVAPNEDTLYSIAWLDLRHGPQVIHVPAIKHRFYVIPLYSPWTENFYNITNLHVGRNPGAGSYGVTNGGNWAVVPPHFHGTLPHGVKRIDSPYTRVWIIGRTEIRGKSDTAAVDKIQRGYTITPLAKFGQHYTPNAPKHIRRTLTMATIPGTQPGQNPLAFYAALGRELEQFGPQPGDHALLSQLRKIDVGPGLNPVTDPNLSPATLQGMRDAVTQGPANLKAELIQLYLSQATSYNGYLLPKTGNYGTDYQFRALVDKVGLGALRNDIATYPLGETDSSLHLLTGASSYVVHIPAGQLPPVTGFWSLTMYDSNGFFVPNPLHRYVINDRSKLHHNPDGSIDLYIQKTEPTNAQQAQNWLPAPSGSFHVIWRLYGLRPDALSGVLSGAGWKAPAIQACTDGHGAQLMTACAS
jgi:hypothetical protein